MTYFVRVYICDAATRRLVSRALRSSESSVNSGRE